MNLLAWFNKRNDRNSQKKRNTDNTNVHGTKDHVQDDRKSRKKRNTDSNANAHDTKGGEQHDDRKSRKKTDIDNVNIPTTKDGEQRDDRNSRKKRRNVPDTKQTGNTLDPRHISDSMRQEVFERDGGMCVKCGSSSSLELDHIIPLKKGGATSVNNLQVLCQQCNRKKGSS